MCCKLHVSKAGPSREHIGGVQSLKPLENYHWLLDYPLTWFSMASLRALNFPNVTFESIVVFGIMLLISLVLI